MQVYGYSGPTFIQLCGLLLVLRCCKCVRCVRVVFFDHDYYDIGIELLIFQHLTCDGHHAMNIMIGINNVPSLWEC